MIYKLQLKCSTMNIEYTEPSPQRNTMNKVSVTRRNHFKQKVKHHFKFLGVLGCLYLPILDSRKTGATCKFRRIIRKVN